MTQGNDARFPDLDGFEAVSFNEGPGFIGLPEWHVLNGDGGSCYSTSDCHLGGEWVRHQVHIPHGLSCLAQDLASAEVRYHATTFRHTQLILQGGGVSKAGPNGKSGKYGVFSTDNLPEAWLRGSVQRWYAEAGGHFHRSMAPVILEFKAANLQAYHRTNKGVRVSRAASPGDVVPGVVLTAMHYNVHAMIHFNAVGELLKNDQLSQAQIVMCQNFTRCGRIRLEGESWQKSRSGNLYCPDCFKWWTYQDKGMMITLTYRSFCEARARRHF